MGALQNQRRALYVQAFCEEVERVAHGDDRGVPDADFLWRFRNACAHAQYVLNPSLIAPQLPGYIGVDWSEFEPKLASYARTIWSLAGTVPATPLAASTRHGAG